MAQIPDCSLSGRPACASCSCQQYVAMCQLQPANSLLLCASCSCQQSVAMCLQLQVFKQIRDWHETCYKLVSINKLIILWYTISPPYFKHKGQDSTRLAILNFFLTSALFLFLGNVETSRWHPQNTAHIVFVFQRNHFSVPIPEVRLPHFRGFFHHAVDGIQWQRFACKQYFC